LKLEKKKSKIHGFGIYSTEKISAGERFYEVPMSNILTFPKPRCARIGENKYVDDPDVLNFVNHSCESNAELEITEDRVFLRAIKDITEADEITCDYNKTELEGKKSECNCGSTNCRGYFLKE
jgi:SET domain-containing protein